MKMGTLVLIKIHGMNFYFFNSAIFSDISEHCSFIFKSVARNGQTRFYQ